MKIAWKKAYVKWRKRRVDDSPDIVTGSFAESKFLSLIAAASHREL